MSLAEIRQPHETLRFGGPSFEFTVLELQLVVLAAEPHIFVSRGPHRHIARPHAAHFRERPCSGALDGSDQRRGPVAHQRNVTLATAVGMTHLKGKQQHLREHHRRQQEQGAMARRDVDHVWTLERFSSTTNFVNSQSIETRRSKRKSLSILPVPSTTDASGSSAIDTGNPVSSRMRLSKFLISAPPPVSTMPRSLISAESSGGVRSRATRIAFKIVEMHSESASRISLSSIVTVRGTPSIKLRPFTSSVSGFSSG